MVTRNYKDMLSPSCVGILAFEAASTMSSLLSLHRMLSDPAMLKLRSQTMRSQGVSYLNSTDQSVLIKQCCAQLITDLDRAAESISHLSHRCQTPFPIGFDHIYTDLKSGSIDPACLGIKFSARASERRFKKLEKHIQAASKLYREMETLSELEANQNKQFGRFSGPIPIQKLINDTTRLDIKTQAQNVGKLKEGSLWNQKLDKVIGLMALACYSVFVRICTIFGPFVPGLPRIVMVREHFFSSMKIRIHRPRSGPLERRPDYKEMPLRNSCPIPSTELDAVMSWRGTLEAGADTVGGSGLALRYANVIVLGEKMMMGEELEAGEREELYGLIPDELNRRVKGRLRRWWRERGMADRGLAKGWKEAVWRILGWLGPVAHDTMMWEMERNMERSRRFEGRERTYLMQTLHFADKVKTEAAMVEVLVGLSMVCWYDGRFGS